MGFRSATLLFGCSLLLSLAAGEGWSSEPRLTFRRVQIPDDVPAHLCSALAQDREGFLWIGTQGGLVRYDGYNFRTFRPNPDDPHALTGSYVRALLATADGRIWVATYEGLDRLDP